MRYVKLLICTLLAFALILCGGCGTNTEHSVPKTEKVSVWEEKNSSVESTKDTENDVPTSEVNRLRDVVEIESETEQAVEITENDFNAEQENTTLDENNSFEIADECIEENEQVQEPADETEQTDETKQSGDAELEYKEEKVKKADTEPKQKPEPINAEDVEISDKELKCTLVVRCDTVLDNMNRLEKEKTNLIPLTGIIYEEREVTFYEGESVFNLLRREMKRNKIHFEFVQVPVYNSVYIEGINNIYEFDCGELSGWMYKVNDWFPDYGCSRYRLNEGDRVEIIYTCDLGKDIGGEYSAKNGR